MTLLAGIEVHEDTVLWRGEGPFDRAPVMVYLAAAIVKTADQGVQFVQRMDGLQGAIAEVIARLYMANPGLPEAVLGVTTRLIGAAASQAPPPPKQEPRS